MNSEAWWRELPSGGIEVAAIDEGELRRHLVDDRGTMTLLEVSPPTMLQRWGSKVAMAGWLIGLASILGFGLAAPAGRLAVVGGLVWAFAAGLFVAGGIADGRRSGLAYRLDARRGAAKAM